MVWVTFGPQRVMSRVYLHRFSYPHDAISTYSDVQYAPTTEKSARPVPSLPLSPLVSRARDASGTSSQPSPSVCVAQPSHAL